MTVDKDRIEKNIPLTKFYRLCLLSAPRLVKHLNMTRKENSMEDLVDKTDIKDLVYSAKICLEAIETAIDNEDKEWAK